MGIKSTTVLEDFGFAVHVFRPMIGTRVSLLIFPTIE